MTAGRITIRIQGQRFDALDDIWDDHARNVVQILDAHNEAVDRIERQKCFAVALGILGVLSGLVSMALV